MRTSSVLLALALIGCGTPTPTDPEPTGTAANQAPVLTLGDDVLVRSGDPVELDGSATDADGLVESLGWAQVEGAPISWEETETGIAFVAPEVGSTTLFVFELTATDDDGATAVGRVTAIVEPLDDGGSGTPPAADAGPAQVVDEQTEVTLDGSATDDGSVVSSTWSQIEGPTVTLSSPGTLSTGFTAPTVTTPTLLAFELLVIDDDGLAAYARTQVTVQPVNTAPTANAGLDRTVAAGDPVSLVGLTGDADGSVQSRLWTQISGPTVTLDDPTSETPSFDAPSPEVPTDLVFQLTVTDDEGATHTDTVTVRVDPVSVGNAPPEITVTTDVQVDEDEPVTLDASVNDTDGTVVSTTWTQISGPPVVLDDPSAPQPTFTAPTVTRPEVLVFELVVLDEDGGRTTATVSVRIEPVNATPSVDAGEDLWANGGESVTLQGSVGDDGAVSTTWVQLSGPPVVFDDPSLVSPTFLAPSLATDTVLLFSLVATDDEGAQGSDLVQVTVAANLSGLVPPTVDAGTDQQVAELTVVTLAATASDPDGSLVSTVWTQLAGPPVVLDDPSLLTPSFEAPSVTVPEVIVLLLEVTDDDGLRNTDTVAVRVDPVNQLPVAAAGTDRSVSELETVQLSGAASDPDGSVVRTAWTQLEGPAVVLDDPALLAPSFVAPAVLTPTTLIFALEVEDDEGALAEDRITVTVHPVAEVNQQPAAYAGPDQQVPAGSLVQLDGVADDPDGTVVSTTWTQLSGPAVALDDPSSLTPGFTAPDVACAGHLVFELTVTDDEGGTRSDRVAVTVDAAIAHVVTLPWHADLSGDPGPIEPDANGVWSWDAFTFGTGRSWNGTKGWGTTPSTWTPNNADASLCLPAIDREGATEAVLSFRLFAEHGNNDVTRLEMLHPEDGWVPMDDVDPAYNRTRAHLGWGVIGTVPPWVLVTAPLPDDLPDPVRVRVRLLTDGINSGAGAYLDEIRVDLEGSDPDGDGVSGIREELALGSDPFLPDTDGDGSDDLAELEGGTDPRDPSDLPNRPVVVAPFSWDFEGGPGDLVAVDEGELPPDAPYRLTFEHGTPSYDIGRAHSGVNVWGTDLDSHHGGNTRAQLYLPLIDLSAVAEPTLSFRLWNRNGAGDGGTLEILQDGQWTVLGTDTHAYTTTDARGRAAFGNIGRDDNYELVGVSLTPWAGEQVQLRFSYASTSISAGAGMMIDDLAVSDELDDLDGDGLTGVLGELLAHGTDPFVADDDGDGVLDGDEIVDGTDPRNPADHLGSTWLVPGDHLDLELDDGGCVSGGEGWAWGTIGSGPNHSHDGANGWGTNLTGNVSNDHRTDLYLPPIDLSSAVDPVLSFRNWTDHGAADATYLQAYDPDTGDWTSVTPVQPAYQRNGPDGDPGWSYIRYRDEYVLSAFSLAPWNGSVVRLRLRAAMSGISVSTGTYVDEIRLDEEGSDPDGDGFDGVLAELAEGLDPYVADTDGDGVLDGQETVDGTDPTNPADWYGGLLWSVGTSLDLDADDGGMATRGSLWGYGAPAQGPGSGFTGDRVWATGLSSSHGGNRDEALYLPTIDLTGAMRPSLSFRAWSDLADDGISLEAYDPALGWVHLSPVSPAYNLTDAAGYRCWREPNGALTWDLFGGRLSAWNDELLQLRIVFRSNAISERAGVFLDDFVLAEEDLDHDGDGLLGVLDERSTYGTDPFLADTDGDGFDDGVEVGSGSDPLDAASTP